MLVRWSAGAGAARAVTSALAAAMALAGIACRGPAPARPGPLDGAWEGVAVGDAAHRRWTLLVEEGRFFLQGPAGDAWMRGALAVEATVEPATLTVDVEECDCPWPGQRAVAIWRLDGDVLTIAGHEPGSGGPPSSFAPGALVRTLRLQRLVRPAPR